MQNVDLNAVLSWACLFPTSRLAQSRRLYRLGPSSQLSKKEKNEKRPG